MLVKFFNGILVNSNNDSGFILQLSYTKYGTVYLP